MAENLNKLFCSRPFNWFEIAAAPDGRGDVYLCCSAWVNRSAGNLLEQSAAEVWNGEAAQSLRRSILDGSFSQCSASRCPYLKTVTGPVQHADSVTDARMKDVIEQGLTELPWGPQDINCAYDQSCNLSCPTCRHARIIEVAGVDDFNLIQDKLESDVLPDANSLYITGSGDAFGSPHFNKWLRTMQLDRTSDIHIHLHTNAQLWTPKMWRQIPDDVKRCIKSAEISIDAAEATTYSFNRRGGDFDRLLENLDFIAQLRADGKLHHLKVSMVVQLNNFREMPAFVELGKRFKADTVYFSKLINWGTFSEPVYRFRSVHLPLNKNHQEFLDLLDDPVFDDAIVELGNLSELRRRTQMQEVS